MHLKIIKIKNFRRLSNVTIDLDKDITIFVGSNNSGKTSVAEAISLFIEAKRDKVSLYDISASQWSKIEEFSNGGEGAILPEMAMDLWFEVDRSDLHRVLDLLPSLSWQESLVGIRISFSPIDPEETLKHFQERKRIEQQSAKPAEGLGDTPNGKFVPTTLRTLREFLTDEIKHEYEFKYYVLDRAKFGDDFEAEENYKPLEIIRDHERTGKSIVNSLFKVDFLHAQRHLSDTSGSRTEELSRHLSRFYSRNLEKMAENLNALHALEESEVLLNQHLEKVFAKFFERLASLGYPGLTNPRLVIKSALNPAILMNNQESTLVHYALDEFDLTLPDKYNGLGFKNLIYMVVELLDIHAQWLEVETARPPLHLVFVEEPEAHLHAQLQQVFVNKVLDILDIEGEDKNYFRTQIVLTTHSPHIVYERGFRPIRYFRRENTGVQQSTTVLNLSDFYHNTENLIRDFLERYLKLTHCDLFFADAAILVEGNVERLLMPQIIDNIAPALKSVYLSILEIGGAFGHRFKSLIEFLGITTLIITDLDSVTGPAPDDQGATSRENTEIDPFEDIDETSLSNSPRPGSTCQVEEPNAITSNQMLIQWLPGKEKIEELLSTRESEKVISHGLNGTMAIRVCYPTVVPLVFGEETVNLAGRTLEEAFSYENLDWCQDLKNKDLKLRVKSSDTPGVEEVAKRLHKRIHGKNFKKTDFALALLAKDPSTWKVPTYIREGLEWLQSQFCPGGSNVENSEKESS